MRIARGDESTLHLERGYGLYEGAPSELSNRSPNGLTNDLLVRRDGRWEVLS